MTWRVEPDRHQLTIISVRDVSTGAFVLSFTPGHEPDLAFSREKWPRYEAVWNAVRHDYWTSFHIP
ncbi:hypothetical protein ACWDSJ_30410 [Nocardia sp. NPDC003482]